MQKQTRNSPQRNKLLLSSSLQPTCSKGVDTMKRIIEILEKIKYKRTIKKLLKEPKYSYSQIIYK